MSGKASVTGRYLMNATLAIGVSCMAIVLVAALAARRSFHTHTITYRLAAEQEPVDPHALETAEALLRQRLEAVGRSCGLSNWTVSTAGQDEVRLVLRARRDPAEAVFWVTMPGRAEFRLVHPDADILGAVGPEELPEGYEIKCYREHLYRLSRPGTLATREHRHLLRTEPALRVSRFANVSFDVAGLHKKTIVTFQLRETEREQFRDLTARNVGRTLALLIDGELFLPPRQIESAVAGGVVQVHGYFYNPPLRKLVKVLNASPLPGRLVEVSHRVD